MSTESPRHPAARHPVELTSLRVAVVGAGYMGLGIAQTLAQAGATVEVLDADDEATSAALDRLHRQVESHHRSGLIPDGAAESILERVSAGGSYAAALGQAHLVIEAVPESLDLKRQVWRDIDRHAGPETVLATNTSSIPITTLAAEVRDPARFVGMHWFNPAPFVPGVEIIPGAGTAADVVTWMTTVTAAAGKVPTVVADTPGFVANRLQFALFQEAARVVAEGVADAESIDAIVRTTFGFRLPFFGPFAIADMAGLDVYQGALEVLEEGFGPRFAPPRALTELVTRGDLGAKTGRGFLSLSPEEIEARAASRDRSYQALEHLLRTMKGEETP